MNRGLIHSFLEGLPNWGAGMQYLQIRKRKWGMWRVKLYVFLHEHEKLEKFITRSHLLRGLMPLILDFDHCFSDRRYMTQNILPTLASSKLRRVLFVGCQAYTARYAKRLANSGIDYWTVDVDPETAIWGARGHHFVCDITSISNVCPPEYFDAVLLNGVFGHGVDDENTMNRSINAIARILRSSGLLLIGWNSHKPHPNPTQLEAVTMHFERAPVLPLPLVKTFPDSDHVYDWFIKTSAEPQMPRHE